MYFSTSPGGLAHIVPSPHSIHYQIKNKGDFKICVALEDAEHAVTASDAGDAAGSADAAAEIITGAAAAIPTPTVIITGAGGRGRTGIPLTIPPMTLPAGAIRRMHWDWEQDSRGGAGAPPCLRIWRFRIY